MTIEKKLSKEPSKESSRSTVLIIFGSSLFWAWGFLCYLSPVMFPPDATLESSIGIEYGFFASQASAVIFALLLILMSHWRQLVIKRRTFFLAALVMTLSALVLVWSLQTSTIWLTIICGLLDGICVPLFGVAWGTRYSLHSKRILPVVVLSFLVAYLLYYLVSALPYPLSPAIVIFMPLISWVLWNIDAKQRHEVSSEVFATKGTDAEPATPGEFLAGTWEAKIMPWSSLAIFLAAAFVGNLVTSVILGQGYAGVDVLYNGGVFVCACIATMSLSVLVARKNSPSVRDFYRITITFTIIGLIGILVFGTPGVPIGGAFVQGGAMFLQVLIILTVTKSTQETGISPLLSFGVGQGVIAAVVFLANVLGKGIHYFFGSDEFALSILCGCSLLALFLIMIARTAPLKEDGSGDQSTEGRYRLAEDRLPKNQNFSPKTTNKQASLLDPEKTRLDTQVDILVAKRAVAFARKYGLTKREEEILTYLAKGRSLPYIADSLFVTTGTVKTHTNSIYRKAGVNSRQELLDVIEYIVVE